MRVFVKMMAMMVTTPERCADPSQHARQIISDSIDWIATSSYLNKL
jgi:hypothetical protein